MLSKNRIKYLAGLQKKKERDEARQFVIEGDKMVREFLRSGTRISFLAAKPEFITSLKQMERSLIGEIEACSYDELKKISTLKTPHNALAVVPFPENMELPGFISDELCAALDFVQDPGNLGTIIRSASWFGIKNIVCSENCVDLYNPKVIQATMGAILNVSVHYADLADFLSFARSKGAPVYGTVLEGDPVYSHPLGDRGVILLGNESRGISAGLMPFVTHRIMIPRSGHAEYGSESLNVSMAASVVFSEFARRRS